LRYILGKRTVRKKSGTGSSPVPVTTGVETQDSEVIFLPAFVRTGRFSWICSSKYGQFLVLNQWLLVSCSYRLKNIKNYYWTELLSRQWLVTNTSK
jgi:hypothetical protein